MSDFNENAIKMTLFQRQNRQGPQPDTFLLSQHYGRIVNALVETTQRFHNQFRSVAYETLANVLLNAPVDCQDVVQSAADALLEKLYQVH